MTRKTWLISMAILAICAMGWAEEFALKQIDLTAEQALQTPGGQIINAQLLLAKPGEIKKAPATKSQYPLYGLLPVDAKTRLGFLVDESKGSGKGYDTLIVDLNANGDLTDDPVGEVAQRQGEPGQPMEQATFGPIVAPEKMQRGAWTPAIAAQLYVYNRDAIRQGGRQYFGYLGIRPACYLEATIEANGMKETIGIVDGSCNMTLGDEALFQVNQRGSDVYWALPYADAVLRDRNGSGKFEMNVVNQEAEPLSSLIFVGNKPFEIALSRDLESVRIEPYSKATGQLVIAEDRNADSVLLGRKLSGNRWEAISVEPAGEPITVPAGEYRLHSCVVADSVEGDTIIAAAGTNRTTGGTVEVEEGGSAQLTCGAPLDLRVTADKRGQQSGGVLGALTGGGAPSQVNINVQVLGSAGEFYSRFYKIEESGMTQPAPPAFEIQDEQGKQIASGSLEYG